MAAPVSLRLHDAPRYEEFYGFVHPPFAAAPDPRVFVPAGAHVRAIDALLHAIRRRERVMTLTGEPGAGKTTVCRALVARVDEAVLTSLVLEPAVSVEALLRTVLQDFGVISSEGVRSDRVAAATRQELSQALSSFLRTLEPIGGRCVIVVDEAHRLPSEVLHQLSVMSSEEAGDAARLQIVLSGRPEMLTTLQEADVRMLHERVTTRAALEPLSRDEVALYIGERVSAAASRDQPAFEREAIDAVHRHTGGLPLAINAVCDRALTFGAQLEVRAIGTEVIDEAARDLGLDSAPARPAGRAAARRWAMIAVPIALLLALIAAWFSGAASALFP